MNEMGFLAQEFDRCRKHIAAALEYAGGTHDIEHIRESVLRGDLQLWPGEKSAIITEIEQYPLKRCLNFFLAGGDLAELQRMTPDIEQWAKTMWGCSSAKLTGRQGWSRTFLKDMGYEPKWITLAKDI